MTDLKNEREDNKINLLAKKEIEYVKKGLVDLELK